MSGPGAPRPYDRRVPVPPASFRALALASLVSQVAIVVTGGAVRLTGSGLGCPEVPLCTPGSLVPTRELGVHGVIEFGNRMLSPVLGVIALATLVAAVRVARAQPARRDLVLLSAGLLLGIPAQAFVGAVTVRTGLNPWIVMFHFLVSMVLISAATVLVRRSGEPDGPRLPLTTLPVRRLVDGVLVVLAAVIYAGTVTTATGPHAGDARSPRTGLDLESVTQVHADLVLLLIGLTAGLLAAVWTGPPGLRRAVLVLLALELAQGLIGAVQYATDLPVALVAAHLLGAAVLVVAATQVRLALRTPVAVEARELVNR